MRLLRLHVQILPWQNSSLPNDCSQNTRREVILPWIEPCAEDVSLQELSERIISRFASIHRGKGVLDIECLQNYWGYILDMPLTVGEVFDDLSDNTDIVRSIVKVVRAPPTPDELENPLRFISLAPESSARPQKRRVTQVDGPTSDDQHRGERAQRWGSDSLINDDGRASKRRKLQNPISHTAFGSDRPIFSNEGLQDGIYNSSQTFAKRLSPDRQIVGSPRSSLRKQDNSYDTPTSLSLNSPPRINPSKLYDSMAIPDSPLRRDVSSFDGNIVHSTNFELHAPRSESPELGSSRSKGPSRGSGTISADQAQLEAQALQGYVESPLLKSQPLKNGADTLGDQPTVFGKQDARDITDPVDRESEKSHVLPKLSSAKKAKSENVAPKMHNLGDSEPNASSEKAIANTTENAYVAPDTRNKKRAPKQANRLCSRAAGEVPKGSGDKVPVKENSKGLHPVEGGAQELEIENENPKEMRLAEESGKIRLGEEQGERGIESTELATIAMRAVEIAKKTNLLDKRANKATLAEEDSIVRPAERKSTRATLAERKVAEAASIEIIVETRSEAAKQVGGNPKDDSPAMRKTRSAMLAEEKQPVKVATENQVRDRLGKENFKRREESKEKMPRESKESASSRQVKLLKDESPPRASGCDPILDSKHSSRGVTKSKPLENTGVQSEITGQSTTSYAAQKTPKAKNSSNALSQISKTPLNTRTEPDLRRKSMTPPYPSSLTNKPRLRSSVSSRGTFLGKPPNLDTLPRSAIRQTPSSGRRSVSFAEDSAAISDAQHGTAPPDSKNSNRGISSVKTMKIEPASVALVESQAPTNSSEGSEAPATKDAKLKKTRSKLKIPKDMKLKGRVIDPPLPLEAAKQEEIVISSESEFSVSSFYSEDDYETRNARSGSSKRGQLTARVGPRKDNVRIKVEPNSVPAETLTNLEVTQPSTSAPKTDRPKEKLPLIPVVVSTKKVANPRAKVHKLSKERSSTPEKNIDPQILSRVSSSDRSSPRAPAQYMSRAGSISSNSTSSASESDSDDNDSPPVETKRRPLKEGARPDSIVPNTSASVETRHAKSISLNDTQSSRSSKALSVSSRSSGSTHGSDSKRIERAAEEQLQRESHRSIEPSQAVRPPSMVSKSAANKKAAKPPVPALLPANSDFPRMTDLMKKQSAVLTSGSGNQRSSGPLPSKHVTSKRATLSPFSVSSSSSSGSSSDDEEDT